MFNMKNEKIEKKIAEKERSEDRILKTLMSEHDNVLNKIISLDSRLNITFIFSIIMLFFNLKFSGLEIILKTSIRTGREYTLAILCLTFIISAFIVNLIATFYFMIPLLKRAYSMPYTTLLEESGSIRATRDMINIYSESIEKNAKINNRRKGAYNIGVILTLISVILTICCKAVFMFV